jgi:Homeodomain-like domain
MASPLYRDAWRWPAPRAPRLGRGFFKSLPQPLGERIFLGGVPNIDAENEVDLGFHGQVRLDSSRPAAIYTPMLRMRPRPNGFIEPCLPSPAPKPPAGDGWIHEIKLDGFRCQRAEALQRIAQGETQADIARLLNVSAPTISRLAAASPFEHGVAAGLG